MNTFKNFYIKHKLNTPSADRNLLSDILNEAGKPKVKLTPEIDWYIRGHLQAAQEKLERGEGLTEGDLAFMEKARGMVKAERLRQVELPAQYGKRLETLKTFEFIKNVENPVIIGIDGKEYFAPTLEQIMAKITPEKAALVEKYIEKPMLLLVPFAMPLKTIAEKAGSKKGKLGQDPVYTGNYDVDSDLPERGERQEQLVYFPEKYDKTDHGGLTKAEVLNSETRNTFPGWQVLIVDGTETVPKNTLGKSAIGLKRESDALGLSGLTPEDWLALHAEGSLRGNPFRDYTKHSGTWNLASYLEKDGRVPHACWSRDDSRAYLFMDGAGNSRADLDARRAVRL